MTALTRFQSTPEGVVLLATGLKLGFLIGAALVYLLLRCPPARTPAGEAASMPTTDADGEKSGARVQNFPHVVEPTGDRKRASGE